MNNPSVGYYQGNATALDIKVKCKFCDSLLLPSTNHNMHPGPTSWMCISCPNPVLYGSSMDEYTLICQHNESWYTLVYLPLAKQYLIYKIKTHLMIHPDQSSENYSVSRELIKQLESEQNITPKNVKDKLLTILTFS